MYVDEGTASLLVGDTSLLPEHFLVLLTLAGWHLLGSEGLGWIQHQSIRNYHHQIKSVSHLGGQLYRTSLERREIGGQLCRTSLERREIITYVSKKSKTRLPRTIQEKASSAQCYQTSPQLTEQSIFASPPRKHVHR